jgi:hypothetical protein
MLKKLTPKRTLCTGDIYIGISSAAGACTDYPFGVRMRRCLVHLRLACAFQNPAGFRFLPELQEVSSFVAGVPKTTVFGMKDYAITECRSS